MNIGAYDIALIGIGGTVIGALLGSWLGYRLSLQMIQIKARQEAGTKLRGSFAPQLAYLRSLRSTEGSNGGTEAIRNFLYSAFVNSHAAELEKFRFFVKSKNIEAYDKICEEYETRLYPGFTVSVGKLAPSEYFIAQIETLLKFAK